VLLPEGYGAGERAKFESACREFAREFFSYSPFREYASRFNIRAVWAPSADSGVTIPGERVWRNTACGASFYTFGSERYQMVDDFQRLRDIAAHVPYDYIYVLSNTQKYGGGGIFNFYGISAAHHPTRTGKIYDPLVLRGVGRRNGRPGRHHRFPELVLEPDERCQVRLPRLDVPGIHVVVGGRADILVAQPPAAGARIRGRKSSRCA